MESGFEKPKRGRKKRTGPDTALSHLAYVLKDLREQRGMSQELLGALAKTTGGHICRIEQGKVNPSFTTMDKIADVLGVSMDYFREWKHHD